MTSQKELVHTSCSCSFRYVAVSLRPGEFLAISHPMNVRFIIGFKVRLSVEAYVQ